MNYYPFHIGDYVSATRHLSWAEDCAYRRLLDTLYVSERPLPADLRAVCRLVLATTDEQREAVRIVLEEFFVLTEFGWANDRAMREIDEMRVKQDKQREKANKRWQKQAEEHGIASAMPRHEKNDAAASNSSADAMPPTPTPTPTPTPVNLLDADASSSAQAPGQTTTQRKTSGTPKRASQLPDDFEPDDTAIALAAELGVQLGFELPKFRDYHAARGKPMKDWNAALRTWLRNASAFSRPAAASKTKSDQQRDWLNRLTGRDGHECIDASARRLG